LQNRRTWQFRLAVLGACAVVALMFLPVHYKIGCECEIRPVKRRFVAAPYDGTLAKCLVEPGDLVTEGDTLAQLDGRELRWELAGLEADFQRASKSRDAAMAVDNVAEAQQSALEMERLRLKIQLLRHRAENLEIKSPLDGIVITGDLKKTEGAPLEIGQGLFEIAPLDRMIVEVAIPEREILHAKAGMEVRFRVDAAPGREWSGSITKIFPRSELRDQASVYIAEVDLDNRSGMLRPGMKGRARIIASRHALGWNLFHRAHESVSMMVGW
jgi:RND family efflux transporter MFP subunit